MDGLKGGTSFKGLALPASLWGSGWGRSPWAPEEVFAVCLSGHAWPSAGGASLLSSQSPERSHSGDNEKWHFHKVERKCIVSLAR